LFSVFLIIPENTIGKCFSGAFLTDLSYFHWLSDTQFTVIISEEFLRME